jgi:hypothetical protein
MGGHLDGIIHMNSARDSDYRSVQHATWPNGWTEKNVPKPTPLPPFVPTIPHRFNMMSDKQRWGFLASDFAYHLYLIAKPKEVRHHHMLPFVQRSGRPGARGH